MRNKTKTIELLLLQTYLTMIKNSANSELFKSLYAKVSGKKKDITQKGELSCAFFVSSILVIFQLIENTHATVSGTVKDMEKSGWKKIKRPKIGSIIIWKEIKDHKHIGFYIGANTAISNNSKKKYPTKHNWTFNNKREVEYIYWNKKLD